MHTHKHMDVCFKRMSGVSLSVYIMYTLLHPQSKLYSVFVTGIQPWEETYTEMAKAMGIDPSVSS